MFERTSFPLARAADRSSGRRFDHRLTAVALALAIIVAAAILVRSVGPIPETESDPDLNTHLVGP